MTTTVQHRLVANRLVFTYQPDRWPDGVLTGYSDGQGGFVLEHVIAFRRGAIIPMLKAGIEEARDLGYAHITFAIPDEFPKAPGLAVAARRVGCEVYKREGGWTYYVRYLT